MLKAACITALLFLFAGLASAQVPVRKYFLRLFLREHRHFGVRSESDHLDRDPAQPERMGSLVRRQDSTLRSESWATSLGITVRRTSPKPHRTAWSPRTSQAMSRSISSDRGSPSPWARFTPFAEAFVGVAHIHTGGTLPTPSNTSFAYAFGGGLDYKIIRPIALRVEGDYLRTSFFSTDQNNFRLGVGVVVRF